VAWSLALFGLVRLGWVETHVLLPLTALQGRFAFAGFGSPALPIDVTLACSGADAFALCAGAILAYPAAWRMRLAGIALGAALLLGLNITRIGTLGRAAGSSWFDPLHVYAWPALLALAIAGYVFGWMRFADTRPAAASAEPTTSQPARLEWRFVWLTAGCLLLFVALSPLYLESAWVMTVAAFIARSAAGLLQVFGIQAQVSANLLLTSRGAFVVTQECVSTPLIPIYLAAVLAYTHSWRGRVLALLAAGPLFVGLGIARLLVVALPAALVGSPLFLVHAFYQLLLAGVVVFMAAWWRHGIGAPAARRALGGGLLGAVLAFALGPLDANTLGWALGGATIEDPQGALAFLPAFQAGLFVALFVATFPAPHWRPFVSGVWGLGVLCCLQIAGVAALRLAAEYAGGAPPVTFTRAWALAGPLIAIVIAMRFNQRAPALAGTAPSPPSGRAAASSAGN
jgi:exosortase/archaeosortase family protein